MKKTVSSNQNSEGGAEQGVIGQLKAYKEEGTAKALRVLDAKNDPFWVSRSRERDANWIAGLWEKYGNTARWPGYDRGIHYFIIGLGLECPWGKNRKVHPISQYMNVLSDWGNLCRAIRDARNWGLIPWDAIESRQSVGLETWIEYGGRQSLPFKDFDGEVSHSLSVTISTVEEIEKASIYEDDFDSEVESLIDDLLGSYAEDLNPARYQPYYVAVVSEKSGLGRIAKGALSELSHGFDFLNFEGQATTTAIKNFATRLVGGGPPEHRISEKRIRIFYLSDFDYAGRVMVPAFAWKLYYLLMVLGKSGLDVKIRPLALTKGQIKEYDLPPGPVSAKALGAKTLQDRWLREHGKIIEIDSLIGLHPGELEKIIVEAVSPYIDTKLAGEMETQLSDWLEETRDGIIDDLEDLREPWDKAHASLSKAIDELNEAVDEAGIKERLGELSEKVDTIKEKHGIDDLVEEYEKTMQDIDIDASYYADKFEKPKSEHVVEEDDEWLYDSARNPGIQAAILREYKP